MSVAYDSSPEVSASARLSFTQFLRKGPPHRSSSHEQDSRGNARLSNSLNAPYQAFNSGTPSQMACDSGSHPASKLSQMGGETPSRIQLSPLLAASSKRRARTYPRELSAVIRDSDGPSHISPAPRERVREPLTQTKFVGSSEFANINGLNLPPTNSIPCLLKSKTADEAHFIEGQAYMSATNRDIRQDGPAVGSCGRTAAPPMDQPSTVMRVQDVSSNNQ